MSEAIPEWANRDISEQLSTIRSIGESDHVEFKREFPDQGHEVAKEVAAFCSCGGGTVFVGISDDGQLVGLNLPDQKDRDTSRLRALNLVKKVDPSPENVKIEFAVEDGKTVLAISVPKQGNPVFYYDGRPYFRDHTESRPASPKEVIDLVWSHPSSEHKLELERAEREWMRQHAEDSRESMKIYHDQLAKMRDQFLL